MRPILFALGMLFATAASAQVREAITVERILIDVRVTDWSGDPVTDLTADDFHIRIGGKDAPVESVTWIDDVSVERFALHPGQSDQRTFPAGRLFVIFIQTDFARESSRIQGQMKFLSHAETMVRELEPEDRVAVFSFDSHLKFRSDLTTDRDQTVAALREALLINHPPPPPIVPSPSLAAKLDRREMKRAYSSEAALLLVGKALRSIPGPKSLLLLGWGLGELTPLGVRMKPQWALARRELEAARASIFALDTTVADYHDLEIGLSAAAEDTGGFYAKTHIFPRAAVERLQRALTGHYELELRRPAGLTPGTHELIVRVDRRFVDVLAPASWMDQR